MEHYNDVNKLFKLHVVLRVPSLARTAFWALAEWRGALV